MSTVKNLTMKTEESGMIKNSGTWAMIYTIWLLIVTIMTFTNFKTMYNSQNSQCAKYIRYCEFNRLQPDIRWLKANNKRIEDKQRSLNDEVEKHQSEILWLKTRIKKIEENQRLKSDEAENNQHNIYIGKGIAIGFMIFFSLNCNHQNVFRDSGLFFIINIIIINCFSTRIIDMKRQSMFCV